MKTLLCLVCLLLAGGCVLMPNYRFVTSGQGVDDALVVSQTLLGNSLKPLAPVNLRGSRNAAGDLLIEWTRRERIPLGLRDYAGTPNSEEQEVYVVEIYSGATLKRSIRNPNVLVTRPIPWREIYDPGSQILIGSSGVITRDIDDATNTAVAESSDIFNGDFVIEFTIGSGFSGEAPSWLGVVPASHPDPAIASNWHDAYTNAGYPVFFCNTSNEACPQNNAGYKATGLTDGDRLSIHRVGQLIRFYRNYLTASSVPLMEASFSSSESLRVFAEFTANSGGGLTASSIQYGLRRAYNYTANQQVDDFGSIQSSIKVRVMQESAIVGRGHYIEATL